MARVIFDPQSNADLVVSIRYEGALQASYIYTLWKAHANEIIERHEGNNLNPDDDTFQLPSPASVNDERVIEVRSAFYGLDVATHPDYTIKVEVLQGGNSLGVVTDPQDPPGTLTGNAQTSVIFIELVTN